MRQANDSFEGALTFHEALMADGPQASAGED